MALRALCHDNVTALMAKPAQIFTRPTWMHQEPHSGLVAHKGYIDCHLVFVSPLRKPASPRQLAFTCRAVIMALTCSTARPLRVLAASGGLHSRNPAGAGKQVSLRPGCQQLKLPALLLCSCACYAL
jgi:hypothetical protein